MFTMTRTTERGLELELNEVDACWDRSMQRHSLNSCLQVFTLFVKILHIFFFFFLKFFFSTVVIKIKLIS